MTSHGRLSEMEVILQEDDLPWQASGDEVTLQGDNLPWQASGNEVTLQGDDDVVDWNPSRPDQPDGPSDAREQMDNEAGRRGSRDYLSGFR
jgi:hypothetical protein